jgi:uncharacterized protein (DUF2126 family)
VSQPYTEEQWQRINALGYAVEAQLQRLDVGLTMGGEPTFVSIDDYESPQWRVEALGAEKRTLARQLLERLLNQFAAGGGLLHSGQGKSYAGEILPRWALGCYWRKDGMPIWRNQSLMATDGKDYSYTQTDAEIFIQALVKRLGVNSNCILPAYEVETARLAGYTLPLLPVLSQGKLRWSSCYWTLPEEKLYLLPGNSSIGFRLPLQSISWSDGLVEEAIAPLEIPPTDFLSLDLVESPQNSIRVALSVEARQGSLRVFMPPLASAGSFVAAIAAIEDTAAAIRIPVVIEGYPPPSNNGIVGFQITPDPGVIEVNIHPAANWDELVKITTLLYQESRQCRLGTEKYTDDGRRISTGGGAHITIGGQTTPESPLLRRPDLLRSLISYWQNHPSLSYLFAGMFVGPTSQSPRVDEARHESLYELEIAFQQLQPGQEVPAWLVDRLLRNLLIDVTGNTHRTAFCIDKLFPVENPRNQLGLLEFRAFAMPIHEQMQLVQMLLIRAFVAWFWEQPYTKTLIRWGTTLHDRFMLPYYIGEDLKQIIGDLEAVGYKFEFEWFKPFLAFRFPVYGAVTCQGIHLELRHGIEPWHVLGEETTSGGTARYVDSSMERMQVMLRGAMGHSPNGDNFSSRYAVTCNGQQVPLKSTGIPGEYVGGVRFRARQAAAMLHPSINSHSPLVFNIIDTWSEQILGGCTYHVNHPSGIFYEKLPTHPQEAESRMAERFIPHGDRSEKIKIPPLQLCPEYPLTLDLRRIM